MTTEAPKPAYPDNNPKTIYGVGKPSVSAIPPSAIVHLGTAMAHGEQKYGLFNYRDKTVSSSVYYNATFRHLLEWWDGNDIDTNIDPVTGEDTGSGCHHLAHVMACCAIILDAQGYGSLNDDRGTPGHVHNLIAQLTVQPEAPKPEPQVLAKESGTVHWTPGEAHTLNEAAATWSATRPETSPVPPREVTLKPQPGEPELHPDLEKMFKDISTGS